MRVIKIALNQLDKKNLTKFAEDSPTPIGGELNRLFCIMLYLKIYATMHSSEMNFKKSISEKNLSSCSHDVSCEKPYNRYYIICKSRIGYLD